MRCVIDAPVLTTSKTSTTTPSEKPQHDPALEDTVLVRAGKRSCLILEYQHESMPLATHRHRSDDILIVGRSAQCSLSIDEDQSLSRQHFTIEFQGDTLIVRDLASRNGTSVNGIAISESRLSSGDQIIAGNTRFTVWISS